MVLAPFGGGRTVSAPTVDVPIHGISARGSGVGRLSDGRAVFVPRTAPGDEAVVELTSQRPRWARGVIGKLECRSGST